MEHIIEVLTKNISVRNSQLRVRTEEIQISNAEVKLFDRIR